MAYYCINYLTGSNVTGDGTNAAPWQTVGYASTQINGGTGYVAGDEMRIAGSTKSEILGTVTRASIVTDRMTFDTSVDLTASLAAFDVVQIGGAWSNNGGGGDMVWQVQAVTSTTITIYNNTRAPFISGITYDIYKINGAVSVTVNNPSGLTSILDTPNTIGTSTLVAWSDSVIISGGWDSTTFTSKNSYGKTAFYRLGTANQPLSTSVGSVYGSITGGLNGFKFKDMAAARLYLTSIITTGVYSMGYNMENIFIATAIEASGTGTQPTQVNNRKLINVQTQSASINNTTSLFSPITEITNCKIMSDSATSGMGLTNTNLYNRIIVTGLQILATTGGSYVLLGSYSSNSAYTPTQYYDLDVPTLTIYTIPTATIQLFASSNPINFVKTWNIPSTFFPSINTDLKSIASLSGFFGMQKFTTDDINSMPAISLSQTTFISGSYPITVTDTTTGIVWNALSGFGFSYLNTVDKDSGINCIELKSNTLSSLIKSPIVPISIKKGETITVQIKGKIKGSTETLNPSLALYANSAVTAPITNYSTLTGNEFNIGNGTIYNNSTWTTGTYTISNVFSGLAAANTYQEYNCMIGINTNLTSTDSFLIDSVIWTVS